MKRVDPIQRLQALVKMHGSQVAAAKALGISTVYLHDLLRGRRHLSDAMLERIGLMRVDTVVERRAD